MEKDLTQVQEIWDAFLREWPLERLRKMTIEEYTQAGQSHTFTTWIENRLDKLGSIWGGSSFKFGIYSRKDKSPKPSTAGDSYTQDYAWYSKYGSTPEEAFARVKSLVVQVAEAASRGDYAAIDSVDLGEAYKWKIAFHYQDRRNPGVIAVFKPKRLQAWLRGRVGSTPQRTSEIYRTILSLREGEDLLTVSHDVWEQTFVDEEKPKDPPSGETATEQPLNLILYGPPGTGKTYATAELAVGICDGVLPEGREALMARYRELRNLHRVRFVTFHPSFSYEEFVEGIRPVTKDGQVHYEVRAGILKKIVTYARELFEKREEPPPSLDLQGRRLFKMSLGDSTLREEDWIYPDCLENGYVSLGFGRGIDFSGCDTLAAVQERFRDNDADDGYPATAVDYLKNKVRRGDLILVSQGNTRFRAIAEVTGDYFFEAGEAGYQHRRPVRWLWSTSGESLPIDTVFSKRLSQMSIYLMNQEAVRWDALRELLAPRRTESRAEGQAPNCVLIIDEINRANLAKTFGELITLLEPSKRLGRPDEQEAELPYSGDRLGVPPNLYVIGTMNTADRSIALMDTALRRRFSFREMPPQAERLASDTAGIDLQALLTAMNERIERLFDRDHVLGHTYLMGITTFDELIQRFQDQIIPLLQEYFFEDWRRIQEVFNDVDQPRDVQIIQDLDPAASGSTSRQSRRRYRVNPDISPAAIQKIYP